MIKHYKKLNVEKLMIDREFDFQSTNKIINLNESGVNTSIKKLNIIRNISNLEKIYNLFEVNHKICDTLNIKSSDEIDWVSLLGKEYCKKYTENLLKDIKFTNSFITSYHTSVFPKRTELYKNLTSVIDENNNILDVPVYNHSSVSGRTTIIKGHNFLISSKENRRKYSSINSDHLVSIDFKSFEPALYLSAIGKNISTPDVYEYLMKELNIKVDDRSKLKRGILAVLYGATDETARRILGGDNEILEKIKQFFETEKNTHTLQNEFNENGFIFNMYGRPIFSDKSILNKWIQSSAVDFCSLAFLEFSKNHNISVAYLIHDDMTINCKKEDIEKIKSIKTLQDPITKISLPVEITVLR